MFARVCVYMCLCVCVCVCVCVYENVTTFMWSFDGTILEGCCSNTFRILIVN